MNHNMMTLKKQSEVNLSQRIAVSRCDLRCVGAVVVAVQLICYVLFAWYTWHIDNVMVSSVSGFVLQYWFTMVIFILVIPHGSNLWALRISIFLYSTAWPIGALLVGDFSSPSRRNRSIFILSGWIINWPLYYFTTRSIQMAIQNIRKDKEELREKVDRIASETIPSSQLVIIFVVSSCISSIGGKSNDSFLELGVANATAYLSSTETIEYIQAENKYTALFSLCNAGSILPTTIIVAIFVKHAALIEAKDITRMRVTPGAKFCVTPSEIFILILESVITIALILVISIHFWSDVSIIGFYLVSILLTWANYLSCAWVCHQILRDKHKHIKRRLARAVKSEQEVQNINKKVDEL